MCKAGQTSGDYHKETNSKIFEKWILDMVIPNLPPVSVSVGQRSVSLKKRNTSGTQATIEV
jgi:hypothetical protein